MPVFLYNFISNAPYEPSSYVQKRPDKNPFFILIFFVLAFTRCNKDSGNNSGSGTTPLLS